MSAGSEQSDGDPTGLSQQASSAPLSKICTSVSLQSLRQYLTKISCVKHKKSKSVSEERLLYLPDSGFQEQLFPVFLWLNIK